VIAIAIITPENDIMAVQKPQDNQHKGYTKIPYKCDGSWLNMILSKIENWGVGTGFLSDNLFF